MGSTAKTTLMIAVPIVVLMEVTSCELSLDFIASIALIAKQVKKCLLLYYKCVII